MALDSPYRQGLLDMLGDHPLDEGLRDCIAENSSDFGDYGYRLCLAEYLGLWEQELRLTLDIVLAEYKNSPSGKRIKAAQKQWERFRKAEFEFIEGQFSELHGTMGVQFTVEEELLLVRSRAILLAENYLIMKAVVGD